MNRNEIKSEIFDLLKTPVNIEFKTAFLLEGKWYVLTKANSLRQSSLPEVLEALAVFPELPIKPFLLNPVWNKATREYDKESFFESLPGSIQKAKELEIMFCDSTEKAMKFMEMKRDRQFTGFMEMVAIMPGISPAGVYYVDTTPIDKKSRGRY